MQASQRHVSADALTAAFLADIADDQMKDANAVVRASGVAYSRGKNKQGQPQLSRNTRV